MAYTIPERVAGIDRRVDDLLKRCEQVPGTSDIAHRLRQLKVKTSKLIELTEGPAHKPKGPSEKPKW